MYSNKWVQRSCGCIQQPNITTPSVPLCQAHPARRTGCAHRLPPSAFAEGAGAKRRLTGVQLLVLTHCKWNMKGGAGQRGAVEKWSTMGLNVSVWQACNSEEHTILEQAWGMCKHQRTTTPTSYVLPERQLHCTPQNKAKQTCKANHNQQCLHHCTVCTCMQCQYGCTWHPWHLAPDPTVKHRITELIHQWRTQLPRRLESGPY